jgi:cell division protein FtsX
MAELSKSSLALLVVGVLVVSIASTLLVLNAVDAAAGAATSSVQGLVYLVVGAPANAATPAAGPSVATSGIVGAVVR